MRDLYIFRWIKVQTYKILRQFVKLRATPHAIALGASIGVFVGMTPTVGIQMLLGIIIASFVGANRIAAALPAWITNPLTIVPIYSFNYWLGTLMVKGPGLDEFKQKVIELESLRAVYNLGMDILLPLTLGCVVVGIVCAIPTYPIMYRLVLIFRDKLNKRKKDRHRRVIDILIDKGLLNKDGAAKSKKNEKKESDKIKDKKADVHPEKKTAKKEISKTEAF